MHITSHIYQVGGSSFSSSSDAAVYVVKDKGSAALIDAGTGWAHDMIVAHIRELGIELQSIEYIFLTHCHFDHVGGTEELKNVTGAQVVSHESDAQYLEIGDGDVTAAGWYGTILKPIKVDIAVSEPHLSFRVGSLTLEYIHTPGHSPGSSVIVVESDGQKVLFGQDIHGPLNELLLSNRRDYEKSLEFLISLEADILCEGHFGVYKGKESVKKFIESFL